MTVMVVTDSASCLPRATAREHGITVLDLHTMGDGEERSTSGLGPLQLTATYARLLERGGDDGVVAVHLSKELSGTWSAAVQAAAVFDEGAVRVVDTNSAGMVLGEAALAAARAAAGGADLEECVARAQAVVARAHLWLYVHRLEALRRGGRLSAGRSLLSTALAIKPIFHLADGRLELAAKSRTQAKAFDKLVAMVAGACRDVLGDDADAGDGDGPVAEPGAEPVEAGDSAAGGGAGSGTGAGSGAGAAAGAGAGDGAGGDAARPGDPASGDGDGDVAGAAEQDGDAGGAGDAAGDAAGRAPEVAVCIHQTEAAETAERLRRALVEALPDGVEVSVVAITPAIAVHTGPGSVAVSLVVR
ncbi:EDD domain protein [Corynebacterium bovis]|uniref:Fatty acid-binding protein DegV n=5 Tax=Corynebacterium bovis TaxID=36808 RepID=A0A8H9Y548_9CORY|nr:fatty acid-binding protein DegV [Corynebacterium bovis DSM 20582 = CIP 54.80]QQC48120.1 DegV family protein [Corynebacterium bovis]RRO78893.1 EDD domain protein [Corynebacterium bovis]RRO91756.1 EDD domain protein [Corynebacterium bovis]RRQ13691.1 EDD domain protein [Corynebacterium bovis]